MEKELNRRCGNSDQAIVQEESLEVYAVLVGEIGVALGRQQDWMNRKRKQHWSKEATLLDAGTDNGIGHTGPGSCEQRADEAVGPINPV